MSDRIEYEKRALPYIQTLLDQQEPPRLYAICTGACAGLQKTLWSVPGISGLLVGASFPYDIAATTETLGYIPESYVSAETAMGLAHTAYMKALASPRTGTPIGLGVTGSVASLREHRGDHRAWIATTTPTLVGLRCLTLPKGVGMDARLADDLAIEGEALNSVLDMTGNHFVPMPNYGTRTFMNGVTHGPRTMTSVSHDVFHQYPMFHADGSRSKAPEGPSMLLYPGAFNPPHKGHLGLAREAERVSGRPVVFHITQQTLHKTALTVPEMLARARALRGHDVLFGFDNALYIEKARQHPGAGIVLGADALARMLDPRWCPVDPMIDEFLALGTRFYVAGRVIEGRLVQLENIDMPSVFRDLCVAVPGRWDISSTEIRNTKVSP